MCNNYDNIDMTDGDNKAVKDGDTFAGHVDDRDLASAATDEKTHKTDRISFVYLVIVCQICTYSLDSGLVGDVIS